MFLRTPFYTTLLVAPVSSDYLCENACFLNLGTAEASRGSSQKGSLKVYLGNINPIMSEKQPSRGVLRKRCSENRQQIYRRTLMPKCNFNKVALRID